MDLGLKGKKALVCAASKGLGKACAKALAKEGVDVVIVARTAATLAEAAGEIRSAAPAVTVTEVAADITSDAGRDAALAACPNPDILINNAGGPPPGDFRNWAKEQWMTAVNNNMVTPILLIRATVDGMIRRRFGRIVNITSAAVKSPIEELGLSNGARAGLTGFVAGLARQTVRHNVTINNILPGPFETARLTHSMKIMAEKLNKPWEEIRAERMRANPAQRFGDPDEFGHACAFLCSAQSGFITGQNLLLDGGAFRGTL